MNELEFDKALSDFLDNSECEAASEAVYQLIRAAFIAGWKAALGSDIGKLMKIEERQGEDSDLIYHAASADQDPGQDCPL